METPNNVCQVDFAFQDYILKSEDLLSIDI